MYEYLYVLKWYPCREYRPLKRKLVSERNSHYSKTQSLMCYFPFSLFLFVLVCDLRVDIVISSSNNIKKSKCKGRIQLQSSTINLLFCIRSGQFHFISLPAIEWIFTCWFILICSILIVELMFRVRFFYCMLRCSGSLNEYMLYATLCHLILFSFCLPFLDCG